jgi:uncharacterized ParB-like nuclease family protein
MSLPTPPLIIASGIYDIPVNAGAVYLFTLKGTFGGASVVLTTKSNAVANGFDPVDDGTFTFATETNFRAPSGCARLTVTNASGTTAISVTMAQHLN